MEINSFSGEFEFLSNFYPSPIIVAGESFPTVEHCFQAFKAEHKEDFICIQTAAAPGLAKRIGRSVEMRPDWEKIKIDVMRSALEKKFEIPELREKLLATGNEPLVEGNWWHDNTYGDCKCDKCKNILGHNILGKLLMDIRENIRFENQQTI